MDKRPVAAIVGGNSLVGREVRDLLSRTPLQTKLIGADKGEAGLLTEDAGEPVIITELDEENLAAAAVVLLAGSEESSRRAVEITSKLRPGPAIVDLTYTLEDRPEAALRAPLVEPAHYAPEASRQNVIAHPAAILLALFLTRLQQVAWVRRTIAHVLEPASERGQSGIDELQSQTVNLLTFKPLAKRVYDEQVGFNLLARYGADALASLESVELRIEKHLATLLSLHPGVPLPSLRVIQAPVFHGHSVSIWAEFDENTDVAALERTLASAHVDVRAGELDPPTIIGMAGESGIGVGAIAADRNNPRAAWFWVVADNIRIMAENAVAVARALAGRESTGRPQ